MTKDNNRYKNRNYNNKNGKNNKKRSNRSNKKDIDSDDTEDDDDSDRRSKIIEITGYNEETPLINCLMKIREGYKTNSSSNHIAALIPNKDCFENNFNSLTITKGINSDKTKFGNNNIRTHAEMDALKRRHNMFKCGKQKKRVRMSLLVLRVNRNGDLCESAPCQHCTSQLSRSKDLIIDKIYFSTDDGNIVCTKFSDWVCMDEHHVTKGWKKLERINNNKNNKLKSK